MRQSRLAGLGRCRCIYSNACDDNVAFKLGVCVSLQQYASGEVNEQAKVDAGPSPYLCAMATSLSAKVACQTVGCCRSIVRAKFNNTPNGTGGEPAVVRPAR